METMLFAESSPLPVGEAVTMILFFGAVAMFATRYAFASDDLLSSPSVAKLVGSKNPRVARVCCVIGAVVGWGAVVAACSSLSGALR